MECRQGVPPAHRDVCRHPCYRGRVPETTLPEAVWTARRDAHEARVDTWIRPHLERRRRRETHPVEDFLFSYYSHRPTRLRRWHPGPDVVLAGAAGREYLRFREYAEVAGGVALTPAAAPDRSATIRWVRDLMAATRDRPPSFRCFGMHEWAMAYQLGQDEIRHADWPMRLGREGTDAVVEGHRISCTHFDAFRFFTAPARTLNTLQPVRETQADLEQPGCLHANMDLYKWAYKLAPLVPSELVADCFALAREIRVLDMRASPYDLSALGYQPVRVETPDGKAEYAAGQREFTSRARGLRERLLDTCDRLLALGGSGQDASGSALARTSP